MKKNSLISLIFLTSFFILALNYSLFISYKDQALLLSDLNSNKFEYREIALKTNYKFPNLSVTSMNLVHLVARYFISSREYDKAIDLINNAPEYDPLGFGDVLKTQAYFSLNLKDSAYKYSKIALEKLPLNPNHLLWELKSLALNQDLQGIRDSYLKTENQSKFFQNAYFYLSTAYNYKEFYGEKLVNDAKRALNYYKDEKDQRLKIICHYIIFGKENVEDGMNFLKMGNNLFRERNLDQAEEFYLKSIDKYPIIFESYENLIITCYNNRKFKNVINYFKMLPDSLNPKKGKIEFILSDSYFKEGIDSLGCKYLFKSNKYGYISDESLKNFNCYK